MYKPLLKVDVTLDGSILMCLSFDRIEVQQRDVFLFYYYYITTASTMIITHYNLEHYITSKAILYSSDAYWLHIRSFYCMCM